MSVILHFSFLVPSTSPQFWALVNLFTCSCFHWCSWNLHLFRTGSQRLYPNLARTSVIVLLGSSANSLEFSCCSAYRSTLKLQYNMCANFPSIECSKCCFYTGKEQTYTCSHSWLREGSSLKKKLGQIFIQLIFTFAKLKTKIVRLSHWTEEKGLFSNIQMSL